MSLKTLVQTTKCTKITKKSGEHNNLDSLSLGDTPTKFKVLFLFVFFVVNCFFFRMKQPVAQRKETS